MLLSSAFRIFDVPFICPLTLDIPSSIFLLVLFFCQDSPECVRLLSVSVSVFGPRKILQELFIHNKGHSSSLSGDGGRQLTEEQFMKMFREIFVPWCMHEDNSSTSARLDLLLALLDDECFSEQWGTVITHVTNLEHSGAVPAYQDSNRIAMLAMLLEKARDKIARKVGEDSYSQKGVKLDQWHHDDLEIAAVTIASSLPPFRTSDAQFVR